VAERVWLPEVRLADTDRSDRVEREGLLVDLESGETRAEHRDGLVHHRDHGRRVRETRLDVADVEHHVEPESIAATA
jgi:hypothetical protein